MSGASSLCYQVSSYAYDQVGRRWRATMCSNNTLFHTAGDELCIDRLFVDLYGGSPFGSNMTAGIGDGAVCRAQSYPFYDQYGILALATKTGSSSVAGICCDLVCCFHHAAGAEPHGLGMFGCRRSAAGVQYDDRPGIQIG
mmetsp:Transcript_115851/g.368344  ORF Transcript_115851/g.368344 Transcript_115851/m.368344 type:complete len:141 (+) Transcript_115851:126-548(+)